MRLWMGGTILPYEPFVLPASVCFAPGRSGTLFPRKSLIEARPDDCPCLGAGTHRRLSLRASTRLAPAHTTTLRFS